MADSLVMQRIQYASSVKQIRVQVLEMIWRTAVAVNSVFLDGVSKDSTACPITTLFNHHRSTAVFKL